MKTVMIKSAIFVMCVMVVFSEGHSLLARGGWWNSSSVHYWGGNYSPMYGRGSYGRGYYGGGYYGGGYYDNGASLIRARGQATVDQSKAMINYQEASGKYIENQKKLADTYVARQKAQREYNKERWATQEEFNKHQAEEQAKIAAKNRQRTAEGKTNIYVNASTSQNNTVLSPSQLNPATGKITWPESLQGPTFETSRNKMQELFSLKNSTGMTSNLSRQIDEQAQVMKGELRGQIRNMLPNDYLSARGFIEGLANMGASRSNS